MPTFRKTHVQQQDACWCIPGVAAAIKHLWGVVACAREPPSYEDDDMFLKSPDKKKEVQDYERSSGNFCAYATCAMRGWRSGMEDDHCAIVEFDGDPNAAFFSIFDGHGGRACAGFCAAHVFDTFRNSDQYREGDYLRALEQTFLTLDRKMLNDWPYCFKKLPRVRAVELDQISSDPFGSCSPGCTALTVFIKDNKLHLANAGDCRAVLCRAGQARTLTTDHTPDMPDEYARIAFAGGYVEGERVNGCLAMSRALGDFQFKANSSLGADEQIVTAMPDVIIEDLTDQDEFLMIGCDGIWEWWQSEKVIEFIRSGLVRERRRGGCTGAKMSNVLASLFDKLLAPNLFKTNGLGLDNMTCILVDLRR